MKIKITFENSPEQFMCEGAVRSERMADECKVRGSTGNVIAGVGFNPKSIITLVGLTQSELNKVWESKEWNMHINIDGKDSIFELKNKPNIEVCGSFGETRA